MTRPAPHRLLTPLAGLLLFCSPALAETAQTSPAAADTSGLPSGAEIVDRYIEAIGGASAVADAESMKLIGNFTMSAMGISGEVVAWHARPDKMLIVTEIPGMGRIEQGLAGDVGWASDPMQGPRLLGADELAQIRMSSNFMHDGDYKDLFTSLETVGRQTFEGKDCYAVKMVPVGGQLDLTGYFDVETGLQVGAEGQHASPMGAVPVVILMTEYQSFGSLKVPTRTVSRVTAMGQAIEQVLTISSIEFSPADLPDFAPPPQVQALLQQ